MTLGYDGFLPATAHAAVEILRRYGIEIAGRDAVVIGRSNVVGKPAAFLLLGARDRHGLPLADARPAGHVQEAEIVVVAAGGPG